eukprot:Partr_v1_DN28341_c2_g2_i4_m78742
MLLFVCVYAFTLLSSLTVASTRKFWLDTDIGGDPDDIFGLGMLLEANNIDVLGISTVNHSPQIKAQIARFVLQKRAPGRSIRVYAGIGNRESPDTGKGRADFAKHNPYWPSKFPVYMKQGAAFGEILQTYAALGDDDSERAIDAIYHAAVSVSNSNEGEKLQLVTFGPLLNIARAFEKYPDLPQMVEMYSQGGAKDNHLGYNFGVNPRASEIVVNSGVSMTLIDGGFIHDSNMVCPLDVINNDMPKPHSDFGKVIFEDWKNWIVSTPYAKQFGDPMVIFVALNPDAFETESQKFEFTLSKPTKAGFTAMGLVTVSSDGESPVKRITFPNNDESIQRAKDAISASTSRMLEIQPFNFCLQ